jgi:hypothetical protein
MTEVQIRILEDFADQRHTRHTRSTQEEWSENKIELLKLGWIALGSAIAGNAHYITEEGLAALKKAKP